MSDTLNALSQAGMMSGQQAGQSNLLSMLSGAHVANPAGALQAGTQAAGSVYDVRQKQFTLQQAQLQPAYQAMRQVMATNPDPSWGDIQNALAQSARIGGNIDGLVANANETMARGGKPADFMRATALGGMSPWEQGQLAGPQRTSFDTGAGTVYGTTGGLWSPQAGQFTPGGFIQGGLSPADATTMVPVQQPDGTTKLVPKGTLFGSGTPGGGGGGSAVGGGGGGGGGGQPAGPPPGSSAQPGQPLSQKDQDLAAFAQRESGNQNIYSNVKVPGYTQQQTGSGYYQIIPSTWAEGQQLAGVPANQRTGTAIEASPQQQYAVAAALYDKYGGKPWARSAPGGAGGGGGGGGPAAAGPFIGATSAQPVTGGGGGNVQPAGGMQYFSPTGQPMGQGGGLVMPGVQRGPGGAPILTPPSPYLLPQYEQGAKDYVRDQSIDKTLGQRIAPLQSAIGLVKDNPGLVTGPSAENWYGWVQGLATATGINVGDVHDAGAYQQLVKELGRNLLNNGADPTDMARLMREASQPNPTAQGRQALVTLAAEQVGYERIKSMQYREFRSRHPNDANNNSQFYNQETGDFASDLDPKAVAADLIPQAELASYVRGLNPDAQRRFGQTLKDASRLFKFKIPE